MRDKMETLGWVTAFVGMIGLLVFSPVLTFGFAWIGGWILKVCVGATIADGMNLMFNTTRFTPDFIPLACATLATIGKYFKSTQTNKNERPANKSQGLNWGIKEFFRHRKKGTENQATAVEIFWRWPEISRLKVGY